MKLKKKNGKMVAEHKEQYEKKKKSGVKKPTSAKTFQKSKLMKKGGEYSY